MPRVAAKLNKDAGNGRNSGRGAMVESTNADSIARLLALARSVTTPPAELTPPTAARTGSGPVET